MMEIVNDPRPPLMIVCDGCGAAFVDRRYTHIDQVEALRAAARASGWTGDMNRLSTRDKCAVCVEQDGGPKV
jgi:hypothetical protein